MHLVKYHQRLFTGPNTISPEDHLESDSVLGLRGVVEWGVFLQIAYSAVPADPVIVEIYACTPDREGMVKIQEIVLDAPEDTDTAWYFVEVDSCAPMAVEVVVKNPDTEATVTVHEIVAVVSQLTESALTLNPKDWNPRWGALM